MLEQENEESDGENSHQLSPSEGSIDADNCLSSEHVESRGVSREGSATEAEVSQMDEEILTCPADQNLATNAVADMTPSTPIISAQASATQHSELNATPLEPAIMAEYANKNITRVDGKGLWRSWKRNFNSQVSCCFASCVIIIVCRCSQIITRSI